MPGRRSAFLGAFSAAVLLSLTGCKEPSVPPAVTSGDPLPHRAYVWQRQWTPAVSQAVSESRPRIGHVLLGCEVTWRKDTAQPLRASIDWPSVRNSTCSLALRVAPHAVPLPSEAAPVIIAEARKLLADAQSHQVTVPELQLDFDCAEKKLSGYLPLVQALRAAIQPVPLVITTLPVWLDEPEFPVLIAAADRYVLQVHSVRPARPSDRVAICDPERARQCVAQAAKLGRDFEVALPTYSALVGLSPDGSVIGYAFEGSHPAWPAGTRSLPYRCEPNDMADLVREWTDHRPAHLRGVLWFRLPVPTDTRNWTWPQLQAAMEGRHLKQLLSANTKGDNPVDILLNNEGEDHHVMAAVIATWETGNLIASEALPGWRVAIESGKATFAPGEIHPSPVSADGTKMRRRVLVPSLPPGVSRSIGWLRFDQPAAVHVEVVR